MLRVRVIPTLLLKNQGLYKTTKFKNPKYVGDPINAVKIFNEKEADELVFLDISASKENKRPNFKMIENIASEAFMPIAYGGGIKNLTDIQQLFKIGIEKIVINTYAHENPNFIREAANIAGSQSIVVSIDVKKNFFGKYEMFSHSGTKKIKKDPFIYIKEIEKMGAGEIVINSIDKDGTRTGFDIALIEKTSSLVNLPIIALGGAGSIEDLGEAVNKGGASGVAAGSMFVFYGKHRAVLITYPKYSELIKILDR